MKINVNYILIYSLLVCIALYITENIYHPVYFIQLLQKVITFFFVPICIGYLSHQWIGKFGYIQKESFKYGIGFGVLSVGIILLSYFLLQDLIDWKVIQSSIHARGVNETTFLFVFFYIMFGNSLIEEYFFRGIIFRILLDKHKILAYIISSLLFSLYHITIFGTWFSGYILIFALFGLFIGGLFFAWLLKKHEEYGERGFFISSLT